MKKQIINRGLFGFPTGIALGYAITIIISAIWGNGNYLPVTQELLKAMGNEINAVIFQAVLCGIMGSCFAMASVIWEIDNWSIAKQSGIYFAVISAIMLPIAYFANWMQHTLIGILSYFAIFVAIFIFVWLIQYFGWKAKIKKVNRRLKDQADTDAN